MPGVNISQFDNLNASANLINTAGVAKIGDAAAVTIINPGIDYTQNNTSIKVIAAGSNAILDSHVRKLTVNNTERLGRYHLAPESTDSLGLSILGYNQELASIFKEPLKSSIAFKSLAKSKSSSNS